MIPIADNNRVERAPVASRTILATCIVIFLWQWTHELWGGLAIYALGFTPASFFAGGASNQMFEWVPYGVTLISYAFLHAGWLHLLSNMLVLWIFGDDVEDVMGHATFIVFYLMAGMAAAFAQAYPDPGSSDPVIGASGAISGVLGAYLVLLPRAQVRVLVPIFIVVDVVTLPAWIVLVFWFGVQLLYQMAGPEVGGNIAFRAHIGGFIFGVLATPVIVRIIRARRVSVAS
jgi:membrane associated rhomboid family serine protease